MSDGQLRRLQRDAQRGDLEAALREARERRRACLPYDLPVVVTCLRVDGDATPSYLTVSFQVYGYGEPVVVDIVRYDETGDATLMMTLPAPVTADGKKREVRIQVGPSARWPYTVRDGDYIQVGAVAVAIGDPR